jgi:hypothetical protein
VVTCSGTEVRRGGDKMVVVTCSNKMVVEEEMHKHKVFHNQQLHWWLSSI